MKSIMRIQQGDNYAVPFPIYISGELATPDNVSGVRIQLNDTLATFPGELTFDEERKVWQYPLSEEKTRSWPLSQLPAQVGVKLDDNDWRYCPTFYIDLEHNIITDTWEGDVESGD